MATVLIDNYQKTRISQRSFSALWRILATQIYVNRLDLVFAYWESAYQHFSFNLNRYYKGQTEGVAPDIYTITEQDVTNRDEDIDNFLLFHNALGALLLHREEYQFISRIFKYSNSTFPDGFTNLLITSQLHIIEMFEKTSYYESGIYIESIYPFKNIEGITASSQIVFAIQRYLTLLLIRSENVDSYIDKTLSYIPVMLGEIQGRKKAVEKIKSIVTQLFEGGIIAKIDAGYVHKEGIESKLTDYTSLLDDGYNQRRVEQAFDKDKVEEYYDYFKTQFDKLIDELSRVFKCRKNISEHLECYRRYTLLSK